MHRLVTARVETLGELDAALKAARESKSGAYIEVIGGRMDMPKGLPLRNSLKGIVRRYALKRWTANGGLSQSCSVLMTLPNQSMKSRRSVNHLALCILAISLLWAASAIATRIRRLSSH